MGIVQRDNGGKNRERPQSCFSQGAVERPSFANHFLWPRILPSTLPRPDIVPNLLVGGDQETHSRRIEALTSEQRETSSHNAGDHHHTGKHHGDANGDVLIGIFLRFSEEGIAEHNNGAWLKDG